METTMISEEEVQAYNTVVEIVGQKISPGRLSRSGARSYLAIVLDNNPHRTLCRIYLNGNKKQIGTISERKVETRTSIDSISDIRRFSGEILNTLRAFDR